MKTHIHALGTVAPDIIIGGDFNLPKVDWTNGQPTSLPTCSKQIKDMTAELEHFCNEFFLTQVINQSTHKDGNILDLVFTNNNDLICDVNVNETLLSISHHKIIEVSTSYMAKLKLHEENGTCKKGFNSLNFSKDKVD